MVRLVAASIAAFAGAATLVAGQDLQAAPVEDPTMPSGGNLTGTAPTTITNMTFTNPTSGTEWAFSGNETITWTPPAVDDPQNISLLIVNVYNTSMLYVGLSHTTTQACVSKGADFDIRQQTQLSYPARPKYLRKPIRIQLDQCFNSRRRGLCHSHGRHQQQFQHRERTLNSLPQIRCLADRISAYLQYAQGGFFSVNASESTDSQGSGFSIASSTVSQSISCWHCLLIQFLTNRLCRPFLPTCQQVARRQRQQHPLAWSDTDEGRKLRKLTSSRYPSAEPSVCFGVFSQTDSFLSIVVV